MTQPNHKDRAHALLSPSAADRWVACPPSARLCEQYPDESSPAAEEGTKAHELCEILLRRETYDSKDYTPEMIECAEAYAYYVTQELGLDTYHVEQRINIPGIPECFGTVDCYGVKGVTLYVIDYKYGQGVAVPAEYNKQMALYAYGLLKSAKLSTIADVQMTIFQPRTDELKTWTVDAVGLQRWVEETIIPYGKLAYDGEGEQRIGDHCRWCPARVDCRAHLDLFPPLYEAMQAEQATEAEKLSVLDRADEVIAYLTDLKQWATNQLLCGQPVTGWKLVEGRSVRTIPDYAALATRVASTGISEETLYERKPLGLTNLKKVIGSKLMTTLEEDGLIIKPEGKPTLVREEDPRKPLAIKEELLSHF